MQANRYMAVPGAVASMRLDWPEALRCAGWMGIIEEIEQVSAAALRLKQILEAEAPRDLLTCEALTWMVVTKYGRCFNASDGRNAKLEPQRVKAILPEPLDHLHSGLLDKRNGAFAHAGVLCSHQMVAHLVPKIGEDKIRLTPLLTVPSAIFDAGQAALIIELCSLVRECAVAQIEKARLRLIKLADDRYSELRDALRARVGQYATSQEIALNMAWRMGLGE